jgi:O-antigen/teichoic acid export membrane protein
MSGRVSKSIKNAEVNLIFYFLALFLAFFSRKIFLECLGAEFIGLNGTLSNILGYLNLAELGIGGSIGYLLYKPLQQKNTIEISEILSVFGYLYNWIGGIILGAGILISLFFPLIFGNTPLGLGIVYFSFFSILGSSLIGYFINYRQILLSADQKNYLVAIYSQSANLVKISLQIYLAYNYKNLYLWVAIEFLFGIIGCIILNWKINKEYPWLRTDKSKGRSLLKKYPSILTYTRQIFIHKIKDFLIYKSDELFIFLFVSLKMVAFYGNYTIVVSKIGQLFSSVLGSMEASIGNLVAEGNKQNTLKVFWEITTIRHFVAGFLCFSIYHFIEPFINLWLGPDYILSHEILILLVLSIYIGTSRGSVDMFNATHGLFADTWTAWLELFLTIIITLVGGYFWGIAGILLNKVITTTLIGLLWKPYYLFHSGFHLSYSIYWKGASRNFIVSIISFIVAHILFYSFGLSSDNYLQLLFCAFIGMLIYLSINLTLIFLFCKGAKEFYMRAISILHSK